MDDRQTRITEGAGLEESRLNQELIDWLNKWGFRILMVVLLVAAAWVGKTRWDEYKERSLDTALVELEAEVATGSPDNLVALAKEHSGIDSVWEQAMLNAAAIKLEAGRKALIPGGDPMNQDDFLEGDKANEMVSEAAALYTQIVDRVGKGSTSINALNARSGRVSALISLQDADGAKAELNELIALLEKSGYTDLKRQAEERLAKVDELVTMDMLPSYAELSVLAQMRGPIAMYGETPDDISAIRSRMLSEELIEPADEEPEAIAPIDAPDLTGADAGATPPADDAAGEGDEEGQ